MARKKNETNIGADVPDALADRVEAALAALNNPPKKQLIVSLLELFLSVPDSVKATILATPIAVHLASTDPAPAEQLLTPAAAPIADRLAKRATLQIVLSAGVMALDYATPADREFFFALATVESPVFGKILKHRQALARLMDQLLADPALTAPAKKQMREFLQILKAPPPRETTPRQAARPASA